ncbi:P-loop NTPase [Kitasatospora sp. RB6PN24]|uniref:KGGVGR-motif variant AAA ATPase n=1 Tax=Kitasatospora humi TaxID=2893891 RepID=UPI001E2E5E54|nr:P-loop NTPase [Kitasatospora humi]MCC9307582.1 P-loop NTPase [Kitasatospora humi]
MNRNARFDEAWQAGLSVAERVAGTGWDVLLVRDLLGRLSLVIDDREDGNAGDEGALTSLKEEFTEATRPFTGKTPVQRALSMFAAEVLLDSPDVTVIAERPPGGGTGRLSLLERTVVGADWLRPPHADGAAENRRVALYGFKGGVGRSTATTVLARHLADQGRCVLVVDLDLESPGVSGLLQEPGQLPDFGVVDHLVEAAVGGGDDLDLVCRSSVLPMSGNGEVWLAPAGGRPREGYEFLAKLNRIYSDLPPAADGSGPRTFAERLDAAITACEDQVARLSRRPDVVLLDSRAGIHDIAAVTITQLSGLALLFAVDNPGTWAGYGMLFDQWRRTGSAARVRERLRLVAAMMPAVGSEERLHVLRDNAQEQFGLLYDDEEGVDFDAFNPPLEDENAPHAPIPIYFSNELVGLDPALDRDWIALPHIANAYGAFLGRVERLMPEARTESA